MKLSKNTFDFQILSRILIGVLFVVAGLSKIGVFNPDANMGQVFKNFYSQLEFGITFLPSSLALFVGILVILIEIPVAILFMFGYKKNWTGGALIVFTALVTIFFHNPFLFNPEFSFDFVQLVQALKNIAIMGGILATLDCICNVCVVKKEKHTTHHSSH